MRAALVAGAIAAVLAAPGCNDPRKPDPIPAGIVIREASLVLRAGPIGVKNREDGTYVFVDVENQTAEDRDVAIVGDLHDPSGKAIEALSIDEMRVPAGGQRTYALVAPVLVPDGTTAKLRVHRAPPSIGPPSIVLSPHPLSRSEDGTRPVQIVTVRNMVSRDAHVTVAATFRDDAGAILARPFVILELRGGRSRDFDFLGPAGATRADVFVSEITH